MTPRSSEPTVSRETARRPRRANREAVLRVLHPPELAAAIPIPIGRDAVILGRDPEDGTPAIDHPTVSRRHFSIEWDAGLGQHAGGDLGSHNGSHIDGH